MSAAALFPVVQWFDDDGNPLAAGKIFSYLANTSTPKSTYADALFAAANPNPLVLDGAGRGLMFLLPEPYKFIIKDQNNVQIGDDINYVLMPGGDLRVTSIIAAYTADYADEVIQISAGGPFTIALPTAVGHTGKVYHFKSLVATTITVDAFGTETIDGSTTFTLTAANAARSIYSDGSNWRFFGVYP